MNPKEQVRLQVLNAMLQGQVEADEAALVLHVSERHLWRLLAAYRKDGAASLAHGNRGQRPGNAVPEEVRRLVVRLATERYGGVNHTHLSELLAEREGVSLSRPTVRRILVAAGMPSPRRRRPARHRVRRERMPQEGMLVQIDGSDHDWLEGRGPRLSLLLAMDDATGTVPHALFRPHESTEGYFQLMRGMMQRHGLPVALYSDRHGTFQNPRGAHPGPTQFGRAMAELGVQQIFAHSPQAKGRIERANDTFQDRLVSELRLAGADSMESAHEVLEGFLPRFNTRFGVTPREAASAYRSLPTGLHLDDVLCWRYPRRVARDNTVQLAWRVIQLLPSPHRPSYAGAAVEVRERLDRTLSVWHDGLRLASQERPSKLTPLRAAPLRPCGTADTFVEQVPVAPPQVQGDGKDERTTGVEPAETAHTKTVRGGRRSSPTPRQQERWMAIERALRDGLSTRAIAKRVGMSRNTVSKYLAASGPPTNKPVGPRRGQRVVNRLLTISLTSSPLT